MKLLASFAFVLVMGVVTAMAAQEPVVVRGEVRSPGSVVWKSGMTVQDAVDAAGGGTEKFSLTRSHIERPAIYKDGKAVRVKISGLKAGTPLLPGDTLVAGRRWM
jgi:protein involved in polysaccharide export with SLBB domain